MFVEKLPECYFTDIGKYNRWGKRYPLKAVTSFDKFKENLSRLSYKTVANYYVLPLSESGRNATNRLDDNPPDNPSISKMIETIKNEWNMSLFKEIEVIGDKVKILDHYFDLELFYKQYKRLINCLYYFDYSYYEIYDEYQRANSFDPYFGTTFLEVCFIDGDVYY